MYERERHTYNKKNDDYWTKEIFDQRRKRIRLGVAPRDDFLEAEEMYQTSILKALKKSKKSSKLLV
jgi:hypothetical protein